MDNQLVFWSAFYSKRRAELTKHNSQVGKTTYNCFNNTYLKIRYFV